jgi:hypothetical protein
MAELHPSGSAVALGWLCGALVCLGACSSDDEQDSALDSTLAIAACADADWVTIRKTLSGEFALHSMGTVTEVGTGVAAPCFADARLRMGALASPLDAPQQFTWFRIQPIQRGEILLQVAAPGFASPIQSGDVIRVDAWSHPRSFGQGEGWLELRDESGRLLFWYGEAGRVAGLKTPEELQLSEGDVQARPSNDCVSSWEQKRLEAEVAGVSARIAWSEQAVVGDWLVSNLGVSVARSATCPDSSPTFASAALWPRSLTLDP